MGQRLVPDVVGHLCYANIRAKQKPFGPFYAATVEILGESHPSRSLEDFAEVEGTHVDVCSHVFEVYLFAKVSVNILFS